MKEGPVRRMTAPSGTGAGAATSDMKKPFRIVIADDHPVVRDGLSKLLDAEADFEVVGCAADGLEAVELVRRLHPDVLMLDLAMPRSSGMETLRELAKADMACRVILLAAAMERDQIIEALQLGARGVVLKDAPTHLLFKCVRAVMAGQYWIGQDGVSDLISHLRKGQGPITGAKPSKPKFGLTRRELQVVGLIVAGYMNREIAERFSLSEDTVKHHLSNIFDKLGVSNRLELALFAINHHLVDELDENGQIVT
jgi:DNA-binding NarL/FixJ family response regulator